MDQFDIALFADVWAGLVLSVALLVLLKVFSPGPLANAPVRQGRVSLLTAFGILTLYLGLEIAALQILIILGVSGTSGPRALGEIVIFQGADAIVKLLVCAFILWMMRWTMMGSVRGWGLGMADLWRGLKYGIVAMVASYPLLVLSNEGVAAVLEKFFGKEIVPHETFDLLSEHPQLWQTAVLLIAASVAAPVAEELFFRGVLQTALIQKGWGFWWEIPRLTSRGFEVVGLEYGSMAERPATDRPSPKHRWGAILITAALFAAIHLSPTNFPVLFLLGIALGYVYERTGNLWASITLHALFNLTNLMGFFLNGGT